MQHRPFAIAEANGAIEQAALGQRILEIGAEADLDLRQGLAQPRQPGHQPALGKGRRHVDTQPVAVALLHDRTHCLLDIVKGKLQRCQKFGTRARQFEIMMMADQKVFAQLLFQIAHLAADRTLREVQQLGRPRETACLPDDLEHLHRRKRR